jgi:hypothetical protein
MSDSDERKAYPRLWRWLLRWLQRKCQHSAMKADILEGDGAEPAKWCETCGAVRIGNRPLRECQPTWEPKR